MDLFVAPAQTQCLQQSRNLGKHGRLTSTEPELSTIRSSEKGHSLSLSTFGALKISKSTPAGTQLLPPSRRCLRNEAHANPESLNEDTDPVESASSPGCGARSHVIRGS